MQTNFAPIGQLHSSRSHDNSFWPSFTDIMMVITMIFLMATSLLVVRNWQLVAELRESVVAEQVASQLIESTSQENATLEERLANAEQSNSILRLRVLKRDEELLVASNTIRQQEANITALENTNIEFRKSLNLANATIAAANLEIGKVTSQFRDLENQLTSLRAQMNQQIIESNETKALLATAQAEIESLVQSGQAQQQSITSLAREKQLLSQEISSLAQDKQILNQEIETFKRELIALKGEYSELLSSAQAEIDTLTQSSQTQQQSISSLIQEKQLLSQEIEAYNRQLLALKNDYGVLLSTTEAEIETLTQSSQAQQQSISSLTQEKILLNREIEAYNSQLLTLKGDYEVVKSKYEELIKPARSAKGKYIAEVYYVKSNSGKIIRYRQPGDNEFVDISLAEVETRLARLKAEQGRDLYVKIIFPQDSGLTYSEAWNFMRNLLVKYDYYYQEN